MKKLFIKFGFISFLLIFTVTVFSEGTVCIHNGSTGAWMTAYYNFDGSSAKTYDPTLAINSSQVVTIIDGQTGLWLVEAATDKWIWPIKQYDGSAVKNITVNAGQSIICEADESHTIYGSKCSVVNAWKC